MRSRRAFAIATTYIFAAVLMTGCHKKVAVAPPPAPPPAQEVAPPPPPSAPTVSLVADPAIIERGQAATLRWSSTDATEVNISGLGVVTAQGTQEVRPTDSTMYIVTADGPGGSASASATVSVKVPAPPPVVVTKSFAERVDEELFDAYFDYDQNDVRQDAVPILTKDAEALGAILADFPDAVVYLEGHCDERGSEEYNLALGDRRTVSASAFLEQLGVPVDRVKTISFGREKPQCTEATEDCWQKNRRVHFSAKEDLPEHPQISSAAIPNE